MRKSIFTLWLATFIGLLLPALACKQNRFEYAKFYENCNEGLATGNNDRIKEECDDMANAYVIHNSRVNGNLGRDITAVLSRIGHQDPKFCIGWTCTVTAWRYREWQTEFPAVPKPVFDGWNFTREYISKKTVDC
ncbi:hypothetical protein J1614_004295 [Plenodomus biglobosus]|nr:hypothetical protein J1614_004295 [Plenodomus biglobosus]